MAAGVMGAGALGGCYVYPAGYAPYYGYPASGGYEGYPYYSGYAGGVVLEQGDYGRERHDHFDGGDRRGDDDRTFHGRPEGGSSNPGARPGGLGGQSHGGGNSHGGGWFPNQH